MQKSKADIVNRLRQYKKLILKKKSHLINTPYIIMIFENKNNT
jgi:hypothetical protein